MKARGLAGRRWPPLLLSLLPLWLLAAVAAPAPRAQAQVRLEAPDVAHCATQINRGLRPLGVAPYDRRNVRRTVFRALLRAPACNLPVRVRQALRLQYRAHGFSEAQRGSAAARALAARADVVLREVLATPRRPECGVGPDWADSHFPSADCLPDAAAVRELEVGGPVRFFLGADRLLVVQVVDALAEASPVLVGAAQLVWMYASWTDCECVPSLTFLAMREDLRHKRVRLEAYPPSRSTPPRGR